MRGECKNIWFPNNGSPARCMVRVELDHDIPLEYGRSDIQLLVPAEFATLLEVGLPLTLILEQSDN
jgi:hypothetical protein